MDRRFLAVPLLMVACGRDAEPPRPAVKAPARQEAAKPAEPSPAVRELLKEDPDLEGTITREEAQAALERARQSGSAPAEEPPQAAATSTRPSEWQRLEQQQREEQARAEARRRRLESITVVAGPDGAYHVPGCEALYNWILQQDQTLMRVYRGRAITLAEAVDSGLARHSGCSPPTAE